MSHITMSLHPHALHCLLTCSTSLGLCHHMCHVAMPLAAVRTVLPCPSWLHTHIAMALVAARTALPCPSRLHAPYHCAPHGCMHCVTVPLAAVCTVLPCPLQLHAPHHRAPCAGLFSACMLSFFFFLLTCSFAVQSLGLNGMMVMWPQGHDDNDCSYGTMRHNDSHHGHNMLQFYPHFSLSLLT
jgi:hypothetical protein